MLDGPRYHYQSLGLAVVAASLRQRLSNPTASLTPHSERDCYNVRQAGRGRERREERLAQGGRRRGHWVQIQVCVAWPLD